MVYTVYTSEKLLMLPRSLSYLKAGDEFQSHLQQLTFCFWGVAFSFYLQFFT